MLPPAAAAEVTRQVALGLESLDGSGLFHRDVTPSNILIDRRGTAKLTDFGVPRATWDTSATGGGIVAGMDAAVASRLTVGGLFAYASTAVTARSSTR